MMPTRSGATTTRNNLLFTVNIVYAYIPFIIFFCSVERVRSGAGRDGEAMGCLYVYIDKIEFIVQLFFKKRIKVVKIFKRVSTFLISSRNIMAMFLFNIFFSNYLINAFLCVNVLKHERKGLKGLFCIFFNKVKCCYNF